MIDKTRKRRRKLQEPRTITLPDQKTYQPPKAKLQRAYPKYEEQMPLALGDDE